MNPPSFYGLSKRLYLQTLCNKYGDFKVATRLPNNQWSKHTSVMEVWHDEDMFWRLEKATDRTSHPCETILDLDPGKDETQEETNAQFKQIINQLDIKQIPYKAYFSGSRGYHIHFINTDFINLNEYEKQIMRRAIIKEYGCDLAKKSTSSMIAIEFNPHPKTGKVKTLIKDTHGRL